jgi:hypothetical protein
MYWGVLQTGYTVACMGAGEYRLGGGINEGGIKIR